MTPERSSRGDARCSALVDAARRVLVEDGLERFVMREIATRAGMKLGNLQYYFATRNDLLEAVIRAEFDRDVAAVRGVAQDIVNDPSKSDDDFATLSEALLRNWLTNGGASVFATLSLLSYHDDRFRRLNREIYETFYTELGDVIRRIDASIDEPEVHARARLITALIDGVAVQTHAAVDNESTRTDLLDRADALVLEIARGASGTPSPS